MEVLRERAAWTLYLRRHMVAFANGAMVFLVDGVIALLVHSLAVLIDGIVFFLANGAVVTPFSPPTKAIASGIYTVRAGIVAVCHAKRKGAVLATLASGWHLVTKRFGNNTRNHHSRCFTTPWGRPQPLPRVAQHQRPGV